MQTVEIEHDLKGKLKEHFGYNNFRGNQEEIIRSILSGKDTFVIMPTGAGKSLCYQLPAMVLEGTAIVISPLIALMKNQVDQLNAFGINAQFLNSTLSKTEMTRVRKQTMAGEVKLLYVAPESLTKEANVELLKKSKLTFVAIDEAHCISEWGHDFRPEYRRIRSVIEELGNLPMIALTATATPKVQIDILRNLRMEEATTFQSSFYRENLYYDVRAKADSRKQLIQFVNKYKGKSGIIYCLSRKKVEEIAEFLRVNNIRALPYHAGLESGQRMKNQDAFLNEDTDVVVATIAFGMGIDKPDVRFVVHYDAPKSLEGYYQETGRGGRDGLEGHCLMFYSPKDIQKLEKFSKDKPVMERENARVLLQEISHYATSSVCRPRQLLNYFGEHMPKDCGNCDNCRSKRKQFEGKEHLKLVLQAVQQTDERFGVEHLARVVTGEADEYVNSYNHTELPVFGKGAALEEDLNTWNSIVRQGIMQQLLVKDIENIQVLRITERGKEFLESPWNISLYRDHDYDNENYEAEDDAQSAAPRGSAANDELVQLLIALRKKMAKQKDLKTWHIFEEPSIEEMATVYPVTVEELANINRVGMSKAKKFGEPFLKLIKKYVDENDVTTSAEVLVRQSGKRSKNKIGIIQKVDRKAPLEDIADDLKCNFNQLLQEMEQIVLSGTRLNLDYYIDELLDEERQDDIWEYFMEAEENDVETAIDELGDEDYSEEEVRLMRIKFFSEVMM
jgi:ATP-dependent DNA helicase RecQ